MSILDEPGAAQDYATFLAAKAAIAPSGGLDCGPADVNPILQPHQRDAVVWAVSGGRRAVFASFGLGKTLIQLEIVRIVLTKLGGQGRGLIVLPLGVRQEFMRDAYMLSTGDSPAITDEQRNALWAWQVEDPARALTATVPTFIRTNAEAAEPGIYLTNYESVRDGKLDPKGFDVVSLDEAGILRGFGGTKTFRTLMGLYEGTSNFRFVATATPSPNEYIELLAYAAFLDVMDVGQAKTRFFHRDSTKADHLTLHPHKVREFWLWVASWALFIQRPSDLGYDDTGYELPALDVRWHELPSRPGEDFDRHGRGRMFTDASLGVQEASKEKRLSLGPRVAAMVDLVNESPADHFLIWHDLESERAAIEDALPDAMTVWGSQEMEERERRIIAFSDGEFRLLATKPVIAGSGCNFQRFCHRAVFMGIGFKFADFIQAVHRIHRFLQTEPVRIDLIYTEAEREIKAGLERKWQQHNEQVARMAEIIKEYGLTHEAMANAMRRSIGVERVEARGEHFLIVNADAVEETARMEADSVDLIVTSIPFATQYEYTPSYNDFGHTEDNGHFWRQMDYLTPELVRVLRPGRVAAIHVKDRVVPGGMTGLGFQTVQPFHAEAIAHYQRHGFAFLGMKTIVTDVVRENNQTYRLGWTEQCKDGTKMGAGLPEYLLLFRKPPTDHSDGYADNPVVKSKARYTRSRWQIDAHGFERSSGNRPLLPEELKGLDHGQIYRLFRDRGLTNVYDFDAHVAVSETLEGEGKLPVTFMLLPPPSWHPDVWTDVTRMRTLNLRQFQRGEQMHLCPLQFDIVDRLIEQFSNPSETVLDPFAGIGTVPYCAIKQGRRGVGVELSAAYFTDAVFYAETAEREASAPTLFDLIEIEGEPA
jgi:DNA methylase